jgi:hypothetical protein
MEIFELALYDLAPGARGHVSRRLADLLDPKNTTSPTWAQLGLPPPHGTWITLEGSGPSRLVQLLHWPTADERERVLPALWASGAWSAMASGTDPLIRTSAHLLIAPAHPATAPGPANTWPSGIVQFRIEPILNGAVKHASEAFRSVTAPELAASGARVVGQFEVVIGPGRPTLVTALAWPDHEALHRGWYALDRSEKFLAQRKAEVARFGRPLLDHPVQFLAEAMDAR